MTTSWKLLPHRGVVANLSKYALDKSLQVRLSGWLHITP